MDIDLKQTNQDSHVDDLKNSLKRKKEEVLKLEGEYATAQTLAITKQRVTEELRPQYEEHDRQINELVNYRERLKKAVGQQNKYVKETEAQLIYVKSQLAKNEGALSEVKNGIIKARREARPFVNAWNLAMDELLKAETFLKTAFEKLRIARQEYSQAKDKLQKIEKFSKSDRSQAVATNKQTNPWLTGTFYIFGFVVILIVIVGAFAVLNYLSFSWTVIFAAIIISLVALVIIAAIQLRNDEKLSEKNFLQLMLEALKQLPLLLKK